MGKYYLATVLVALLIALGTYIVVRPSRRFDPDKDG